MAVLTEVRNHNPAFPHFYKIPPFGVYGNNVRPCNSLPAASVKIFRKTEIAATTGERDSWFGSSNERDVRKLPFVHAVARYRYRVLFGRKPKSLHVGFDSPKILIHPTCYKHVLHCRNRISNNNVLGGEIVSLNIGGINGGIIFLPHCSK